MTKEELRAKLKSGEILDNLFHFTSGDVCLIFKAKAFQAGDEIIYIPDVDLNELVMDVPIVDDGEIEETLSCCYTGDDFVRECDGDMEMAENLFWLCDWQNPSSVADEMYAALYDEEDFQ